MLDLQYSCELALLVYLLPFAYVLAFPIVLMLTILDSVE